jgi:hypothetical protein
MADLTQAYHMRLLLEAINYLNMFNDFIGTNPNNRSTIDRYVKWARTTLKKNDRIVWFLRFVRIELAGSLKYSASDLELEKLNTRLTTTFSRHNLIPLNNLMTSLTHYMAMPLPAIQQIVFNRQSPSELLDTFSQLEEEAKLYADDDADADEMMRQGRLVKRDPNDSIIIKCPDGLCWVDLEKRGCSIEGRSMGHCGNGGGRYGETIFSLRKPITYAGKPYWYPVATFIRDQHNMLGEMKGRGNEKVAPRYHPDIVILLRSDFVEGIKGGGYLPENNFALDDLGAELKDQLINEKPLLGGLYETWLKHGMTRQVQALLDNALESKGISTPNRYIPGEDKSGTFVLDTWKEFDDFVRELDDTIPHKLYLIATGQDDDAITGDPYDLFVNMVAHELPSNLQSQILKKAGLHSGTVEDLEAAAKTLIARHDPWFDIFADVVGQSRKREDEAWERLAMYADLGWYLTSGHVYTNIPDGDLKTWLLAKPPIELLIGERDLVGIASSDEEDDDEYGYEIRDIAESGWSSMSSNSSEHMDERRREEKLIDRQGKDIWLNTLGAGESMDITEEFIAMISGGGDSRTIADPRQHAFKFESVQRLRLLAGLIL